MRWKILRGRGAIPAALFAVCCLGACSGDAGPGADSGPPVTAEGDALADAAVDDTAAVDAALPGPDSAISTADAAADATGPDAGSPDDLPTTLLPEGVTGCVYCHTDQEMLLALAPAPADPDGEAPETGGG